MTLIISMTLIGLFGVAMHLGYYWAAGALVALFALIVIFGRRSARLKQALRRDLVD